MVSGSYTFNNSFTTWFMVNPLACSANFILSFSNNCLSNRIKRLANVVSISSEVLPIATVVMISFKEIPGAFSKGRLSVFCDCSTPMASIIIKWSLLNFAVGVPLAFSSSTEHVRVPRPFICS